MFPCEACGHPLNLHNPCSAPVSKRRRATVICGCPQFQPKDLQERVAAITDTPDPRSAVAKLAREVVQ